MRERVRKWSYGLCVELVLPRVGLSSVIPHLADYSGVKAKLGRVATSRTCNKGSGWFHTDIHSTFNSPGLVRIRKCVMSPNELAHLAKSPPRTRQGHDSRRHYSVEDQTSVLIGTSRDIGVPGSVSTVARADRGRFLDRMTGSP